MLAPWKKSYDQPRQHIKKLRHYFADKGPSIQSYGFSRSHVWIWELDYKESWVLKNWCFWTVVLEKTLESPLDCKEIQAVHPKGNKSWIFIAKTDAEAETPILWPPDAKNWLIGMNWMVWSFYHVTFHCFFDYCVWNKLSMLSTPLLSLSFLAACPLPVHPPDHLALCPAKPVP